MKYYTTNIEFLVNRLIDIKETTLNYSNFSSSYVSSKIANIMNFNFKYHELTR